MRWTVPLWCGVCALSFAACDSEDGDPQTEQTSAASGETDDSGGSDAGGDAPAGCEAGRVSASGDIDGVGREFAGSRTARLLNQVSDPASLDLAGAGDISFHFEWTSGPQGSGTPFDVSGTMSIEGSDYCFTGSLTLDDGGWDSFDIADFAEYDGEACGAAVGGSLSGCADAS